MPSSKKSWPNLSLISGAFLAVGLLWIYFPVIVNLFRQLAADEDFSYGLLLPLVSAYIVYLKWPQIRRQSYQPSWWGLAVMALGLAIFMAGSLVADVYSSRISFLIVAAGIFFIIGGRKLFLLIAFPLLLLVLMLPLPGIITSTLTLPLQMISSRLAAEFLRALGYPLVLQGNVIDLGMRQLQVVAACSGLRYILSLLALGIIYCYFYQRRIWKAAILLASLVPSAILANAVRVAAMGIYPALQEGFLHSFSGWLIFIFCFAFLAFLNWALNYWRPEPQTPGKAEQPADEPITAVNFKVSPQPYLLAGCIMIIMGGAGLLTISQPSPVPLLQSFDRFPLQLGAWQGRRMFIDQEIFQKTEADAYLDAEYTSPGQVPVSLYIAHYEKQASAGGLGHNPGVCMTGSGWITKISGKEEIAPGLQVNYMLLERAGVSQPLLVYFWNIHQGEWLALSSDRIYKLHTIFKAIKRHRTDWALIRLITPLNKDMPAAQKRLKSFAHLLMPVLPQFIKSDNLLDNNATIPNLDSQ